MAFGEWLVDKSSRSPKKAAPTNFIRRGIQIEYDLANENYYTLVFTITLMYQLRSNFRCQLVRIVFKLNTHRNEIGAHPWGWWSPSLKTPLLKVFTRCAGSCK